MKKILIVDDNHQNKYMLQVLLQNSGYAVDVASDGKEALDLAYREAPDIIISDILMPGMDGFTLCRNWEADPELQKIPFVFYTATYTDTKDEAFALSLGADRFLIKPMAPDEILAEINSLQKKSVQEIDIKNEGKPENGSYYREYNEVLVRKLEDKMMQLDQANKRLSSLYQASCALVTLKPQGEMIHDILSAIIETAGFQQINYFHYEQKKQKLYLLDAVGFSKETMTTFREQLVFDVGQSQGLVGIVADTREIIYIPDTTQHADWITLDEDINSALFVPVQYQDTLFGVLALFSKDKDAFDEIDRQNLLVLANSMAVAFENRNTEKALHALNLQLERRITERTAQLETSNRELETFAYSVSNDLRIPLRAINGYANVLSNEFGMQLGDEGQKVVRIIFENAKKEEQIINSLMEISRASLKELTFTRLDMSRLVNEVYRETALPDEMVRIEFLSENLPDSYGDENLIRQVWTNLLSSAIRCTTPAIKPFIKISSRQDGAMRIYALHSNGIGYDVDKMNMHLLSSYQGLVAHSPNDCTLGFSVVQRIIERHNGRVWADVTPNGEMLLSFSLPLEPVNENS